MDAAGVDVTDGGGDEAASAAEEEAEALTAIYASSFERREQVCADGSTVGSLVLSLEEYGILTLYLPTAADATPPLPPEASKTDSVAVAHLLRYPHAAALPLFIPRADRPLPPPLRIAVNHGLARRAAALGRARLPAAYELVTWLEDCAWVHAPSAAAAPPPPRPPTLLAKHARAEDAEDEVAAAAAEEVDEHADERSTAIRSESSSAVKHKEAAEERPDGGGKLGGRQRRSRVVRPLDADSAAARRASEALQKEQALLDTTSSHEQMRNARRKLPAYGSRDELLTSVSAARVIVVSGETGCGKSTQVPQYLLEEECRHGRGGACKIVVTQPRRIAAIALAERVAAERGCKAGGVVGYAVRLESKQSAETRLLYCTTGVLLQQLRDDPSLTTLSHVVVDEVCCRRLAGSGSSYRLD